MLLLKNYLKEPFDCKCGRTHCAGTKAIYVGPGAVRNLPLLLNDCAFAGRGLIVGDDNTFAVAGDTVNRILNLANRPFERLTLPAAKNSNKVKADFKTLQMIAKVLKNDFQWAIAVGSGTINDLVKIAAYQANVPYIVIATASSMDGYLSANAAYLKNGVKLQVTSLCPPVGVIADNSFLKTAPAELVRSGLGDCLGKVVSLMEWQLNSFVSNELYCDKISRLVKTELKKLLETARTHPLDSEEFNAALIKMLLISGLAMQLNGNSAPASGGEHWISHAIVMYHFAKYGDVKTLHGLEVAVGAALLMEQYRKFFRSRKVKKLHAIDVDHYQECSRDWAGLKIDTDPVAKQKIEHLSQHHARLAGLAQPEFRRSVAGLLELMDPVKKLYRKFELPAEFKDLGITDEDAAFIQKNAKVIRNRVSIIDVSALLI